ncbi:MAG: cellulase family glycosylhydrolase [Lachnospiraceae bacterium]|nr:cellulase family glycosylhydrolase [Lachnospiraceae bacterium]
MKTWEGYKHGVNLGGWLSQCNHTKERYEHFITEPDVETIAKWGADHVRVPVDYDLVEEKDGTPKEEGYVYLDRAVEWCGKYGINMILDLHKTAGFSFDAGEQETGFFDSPEYQERFYRLWESFAKRYGKYEDRLAFELLNEVTDKAFMPTWNRVTGICIDRIRAIAPTIKILVGGYWNNSIAAIPDLELPKDENIVYNFHCYEPLIFTHQGAYWIDSMDRNFRIPLDASFAEMAEASRRECSMAVEDFERFSLEDHLSSAYFDLYFEEAVKIAEERNVALYCGEYGVIHLAQPQDILKWYEMIHASFEKFGIGRAAWSYKEMDFGLSDAHLDSVREQVVKLL